MRKILPLLLFSIVLLSNAQDVRKAPASNWVDAITVSDSKEDKDGGSRYLLIDYQDNLETEEYYAHYAIQVFSSDGIQDFSDISLSYDPSYQTLTIHDISIHRNGEKIDKLIDSDIKTFQRETSLERSLYDGSVTAVVNLTDVRKDDIIEYAYTVKGFNPINKGNYSANIYQQYTLPVERIYAKVLTALDKKIYYKSLSDAVKPEIITQNNYRHYIWDLEASDFFSYDSNVPYWYDDQKRVSTSTFSDWSSVVKLFLPHYVSSKDLKLPKEVMKGTSSKEDRILKLIRFVQDEIRYLGFESGIGAYKPNDPKKVLNQRYGDCKDKSLLLVSLLQKEAVEAYPLLVNTGLKQEVDQLLPSHSVFNHCIVYFKHKGKEYVIDPTFSNQGGDLANLYTPDYKRGLLLKPGANELTELPKIGARPEIIIKENITTDSIGGKAIFLIESIYKGSKADEMRDYFSSTSNDNVVKEFMNFYSELYPTIRNTDKVYFTDNHRNSTNEIKIEEYYEVDDFWNNDFNEDYFVAETQPMVLQTMVEYDGSPAREMPYYLGEPLFFSQETTIRLPEEWSATDIGLELKDDYFSYHRDSKTIGRTVQVVHEYERKQNVMPSGDLSQFTKKHEQINSGLNFQLSYPKNANQSASGKSWISYVICLLFLIVGVFLAKRLYEKFDPKSKGDGYEEPIGGWMVLPLIGLVLTPIVLIFQTINNGYFDPILWISYQGYENGKLLTLAAGLELGYNVFLLVFSVLLIILFFKKRTSLPILMVVFYIANLVVPVLDTLFINALLPDELINDAEDRALYASIARKAVGACIWIPYFLVSNRVKNTFVNTYSEETTAESGAIHSPITSTK